MPAPETIGDQHQYAIRKISEAGLLVGDGSAAYHGYVAYLAAEGSSLLREMRTFSAVNVPTELQAGEYAHHVRHPKRRWLSRPEPAPWDGPRGIVDNDVWSLRKGGIGRQVAGNMRQYVLAAEVVDATRLKKRQFGYPAVRSQMWELMGAVDTRDGVDLRILPAGLAKDIAGSDTAFTILKNYDRTERLFVEQGGLLQPAAPGVEPAYGETWQALYDHALDPAESMTFLREQLARW